METLQSHGSRIRTVVHSSHLPLGNIPAHIAESWRRCAAEYRLDTARPGDLYVIEGQELRRRQEQTYAVFNAAKSEMATLFQQIAKSNYAIVLTDTEGMLLNCFGDPVFIDTASKSGLMPGAIWSERYQGTNGMGTCLALEKPVIVHKSDHYLFCNTGLTCAAAPIFDWQGNVLAVLDASGETNRAPLHILDLVCMSAQDIENRLFVQQFSHCRLFAFHARSEFVGTLYKGLIAIDETGLIVASNRNALLYLGVGAEDTAGKSLEAFFDVKLELMLTAQTRNSQAPMAVFDTRHGRRLFAIVSSPKTSRKLIVPPVLPGEIAEKSHVALEQLQRGHDVSMARNISMALRIAERDVAILLCGETGTGKELFAKAVHLSSKRADQPFVAINCASIPESLIESELFGYKSGAFTGANKDGSTGKISMANGGTLFLDEIGDMPTALQARLLRVLEERELTPLGSGTSIKLDIRLISATHCDLKSKIAKGDFREDLYYRIQGLTLTLPPLRERADRRELIEFILKQELEEDENVCLDKAVLDALAAHPWPGNIRQLRNMLRTMVALRGGDRLGLDDLPNDFFVTDNGDQSQATAPKAPVHLNTLELAEREVLIQELKASRWNVTTVAKQFNISRNTLYRKLERLNIQMTAREK